MLRVRGLSKRFGGNAAVADVSFEVAKGSIVGFLGPNGAGKSTTLRMITGFLAPSAGEVVVDGVDALLAPREARRRFGYMPERVPLYDEMRVVEYLRHRSALKGVSRRERASKVEKALALAEVEDVARRIIGQLSKGYRQRVGLADALVSDPPLLILDEPSSGLDPNQIRRVRELIIQLAGEKTIFLSTHILPEVEAVCERVVIIHRGKLVGEGTTEDLRRRFAGTQHVQLQVPRDAVDEPRLRTIFGAVPGVGELHVAPGELGGAETWVARFDIAEGSESLRAVFGAAVEGELALLELAPTKGSLEDVFTALTLDEPAGAPPESRDAGVEAEDEA